MSAYGHQMEREYSGRSRSSRDSDMGDESGIYMSSFGATIFIVGLVTVGVLLMTLLIALEVMLQSCQNSSAGVVEMWKPTGDYDYCKNFALHAELNSLEENFLPAICKNVAVKYIKEGQYMRDLNTTLSLVEDYFNNLTPLADGHDVVLMDIDGILPSDSLYTNPLSYRLDDEMKMDSRKYFSRRRAVMQAEGYHITAVISSHMDALAGPFLGKQIFKLPNPMYYNTKHYTESTKLPQNRILVWEGLNHGRSCF